MADMPTLKEARRAMRNPSYKIGQGVDRQVYRVPGSRWVYKRDTYKGGAVNRAEYQAYIDHKDNLPDGIAFPTMYMVNRNIIAAEYILNEVEEIADANSECDFGWHHCRNEKACWVTPYENRIIMAQVIVDYHGGNVRVNDGKIYIIDLGEFFG